ncbi:MAG: sigma-70 family RNA polymerase sigma factor [Chloroflexi bacterium]|nr:sigma-70 family RNA polymerase sigma factor [Chloroflexota bacterium]
MGQWNPYQDRINAVGFEKKLTQDDPAAWEVVLEYVRNQVRTVSRTLPRGLNHQEAVEEYAAEACLCVVEKLDEFRKEGPLSAYFDKLIRTAVADKNFKNLMQALTRFLKSVDRLPPSHQRELRKIVRQRPPVERDILLACMDGEEIDLSGYPRKRLWHDARYGLLKQQDFAQLLPVLAKEGCRQAKTVLIWREKSRDPVAPSHPQSLEGDEETTMDVLTNPSLTPLEEILKRERQQNLLECLEKLRQRSEKRYQAVLCKHWDDESYSQIVVALGASSEALVRKWVERGLKNLRECMIQKRAV